jgi:hypothetical protein
MGRSRRGDGGRAQRPESKIERASSCVQTCSTVAASRLEIAIATSRLEGFVFLVWSWCTFNLFETTKYQLAVYYMQKLNLTTMCWRVAASLICGRPSSLKLLPTFDTCLLMLITFSVDVQLLTCIQYNREDPSIHVLLF